MDSTSAFNDVLNRSNLNTDNSDKNSDYDNRSTKSSKPEITREFVEVKKIIEINNQIEILNNKKNYQ